MPAPAPSYGVIITDMDVVRRALEPHEPLSTEGLTAEQIEEIGPAVFKAHAKPTEVRVSTIRSFRTSAWLSQWLDRLAAAGIRLYASDFADGREPLNDHKALIDRLAALDLSAIKAAEAEAAAQKVAMDALAGAFRAKFSNWVREYERRHSLAERLAAGITDDSDGASKIGEDLRTWREAQGLSRVAVAEKLSAMAGETVTEAKIVRFEAGARSTLSTDHVLSLMYPTNGVDHTAPAAVAT
jgi:hypothetical protein